MSGRSSIRVLIVDDEKTIRESLTAYLGDYEMVARGASNGEEALAMLCVDRFDVAIVDHRLPDVEGEDLILHAHDIAPDMRFLIYTGCSGYSISQSLMSIGIDSEHILLKPQINLAMVTEAIRGLVSCQPTGARGREGDR
jgi:YesN/AraC family two-component response regulator